MQIAENGSALQKVWEYGDEWVTQNWRSFYPATSKGNGLVRAALKQMKATSGYTMSDNNGSPRETRSYETDTCRATVTYYPKRSGVRNFRDIESMSIYPKS